MFLENNDDSNNDEDEDKDKDEDNNGVHNMSKSFPPAYIPLKPPVRQLHLLRPTHILRTRRTKSP